MNLLEALILFATIAFLATVLQWRFAISSRNVFRRSSSHATVPEHDNNSIVGREASLVAISDALRDESRVAVVMGRGGSGKTSLVKEYARRHLGEYSGCIWIDATSSETISKSLIENDYLIDQIKAGGLSEQATARLILRELPQKGNFLVVFDNVPSASDLNGWWPPSGVDVIVTSRAAGWSAQVGELELATLSTETIESAGPQLLMAEAGVFDDVDGALSLARRLEGLPLALVVAGGLARAGQSFGEIAIEIDTLLKQRAMGGHGGSVLAAVELSYDQLSEDARAVLDLFAWYAPEGLEARLLTDVLGSSVLGALVEPITEELSALFKDPDRVEGAMRELMGRSLLAHDGDQFALHLLTAEAVRILQGNCADSLMTTAATVLAAAYPEGAQPSYSVHWPECRRLTPHVLAYRASAGDDAPAQAVVDYLYSQASIYLREIAQRDAALDLARESLRLKEVRLGEEAPEVAIGYSMLGLALMEAGELAAAVAAQRRAVKLCEDHNHGAAALAKGLNNLSAALGAQGRATGDRALLEEALQTDERALPLGKEVHGESSPEVAVTLSNLALRHEALGNLAAAIDCAQQALDMHRVLLDPQDGRLGFALNNLGSSLLQDGQAGAAVPLLREALQIREANFAHLDEVHPQVINTAGWLVSAHLVAGDAQAARALADRLGLDWEKCLAIAAQYPQTESPEPG